MGESDDRPWWIAAWLGAMVLFVIGLALMGGWQ